MKITQHKFKKRIKRKASNKFFFNIIINIGNEIQ